MAFIDWLKKLGILRYGVRKGSYKKSKDRPTEFMMDDVFDEDADLINR